LRIQEEGILTADGGRILRFRIIRKGDHVTADGGVRRSYLAYVEGQATYSPEIWRIVCTELWLRTFFDRREERV